MCEVCQDPDDEYTLTVTGPVAMPDIELCQECVFAVVAGMQRRYVQAIEEGNAAVDAIKQILGINPDSGPQGNSPPGPPHQPTTAPHIDGHQP